MQSSKAKEHNLQAALDQLHADVYASNMAPYWVVDRTKLHDEDAQVMDKRKAIPFLWTYKAQIDSFTARKNAIDADLKAKGTALEAAMKAAGGKPTPAIQTQYDAYQKAGQNGQAELQRLGQPIALANAYVEEQISAKLSDALKSAMTKAKVDLILAPDATVSYQPTVDITQQVVTELNALVPSVGITPPAGWQPGGARGQAPTPAAAAPANPSQQPTSR